MSKPTPSQVQDFATRMFDAGLVEYIGNTEADEFRDRMLTAAAETLFWADATNEADTEGTGAGSWEEYAPLDYGWDMLDASEREEFRSDVEGFVSMAWPYLAANEGRVGYRLAEAVGHDFQLTRNGHGAGFWDGDWEYGDVLTEIAKSFGTLGVMFAVDNDGEITDVHTHG